MARSGVPRGVRPHEWYEQRQRVEAELGALEARQEVKYGVSYYSLPEVLRYPAPEHPQREVTRRFDDRAHITGRWWPRVERRGWRTLRGLYLEKLEKIRRAEIDVRKLHLKHTGRGRPLDRKAHVHARERINAREWRDGF